MSDISVSQPPAADGWRSSWRLALPVLVAVVVLEVYVLVHEGGHALAGLLFGGAITDLRIDFWQTAPHTGLSGAFTPAQQALISAAGTALPLLAWVALVCWLPRRPGAALAWLRGVSALCVLNTLLSWIALPFFYLAGRAPADDVTNFLNRSQVPPVAVAGAAVLLYAGGWALLLWRTGGARAFYLGLKEGLPRLALPGSRPALLAMSVAGIAVALLAVGSQRYFARANTLAVPPDYRPVAVLDLAERAHDGDAVYTFTLDRPGAAGFYFLLQDIAAGPVEISLSGPGDFRHVFLRAGADFRAGRATINPEGLELAAGAYEVHLTAPQTAGQITIFTR